MASDRGKLTVVLLVFQVIFVILFAIFVDYDKTADARHPNNTRDLSKGGADPNNNMVKGYYPSK